MGANILKSRDGSFYKFSLDIEPGASCVAHVLTRQTSIWPENDISFPGGGITYAAMSLTVVSYRISFFSCTRGREAEERSGIATGDESLLCEERDRAGSEAGAKEQRPPTGLAAERSGRTASQIAAEMHRQFVRRLPHAADIAVAAAADPYDAALLLGLVSRAGQT